tara:strand:- start:1027 stop:1461 length:435 start_codon:yes stop_codon:yes gene_type:complete
VCLSHLYSSSASSLFEVANLPRKNTQGAIMKDDYTTLIGAIATALAGSKLWDWLQKRGELKLEKEKSDDDKLGQYRDDLRERVAKLEAVIDSQHTQRVTLLQQIGRLTADLSAMQVKLEFLEKENRQLKKQLTDYGVTNERTEN